MENEKYLEFEKARNIVRKLGLKTTKDWKRYVNEGFKGNDKPSEIPDDPDVFYKEKGWQSWNSWFGCNLKKAKSPPLVLGNKDKPDLKEDPKSTDNPYLKNHPYGNFKKK